MPERDRGKYAAFTHIFSNGMLHLWNLGAAGLTHVHLLPAFDFTSAPELAAEQKLPQFDPTISGPDSTEPQAAIAAVKDQDGYNWGYDPYHYATPEGSYSTNPSGINSRDPSDVINYISAHDNQTLFDNNQYKLPIGTGMTDRLRVNNLGLALVGLAQGIPFTFTDRGRGQGTGEILQCRRRPATGPDCDGDS